MTIVSMPRHRVDPVRIQAAPAVLLAGLLSLAGCMTTLHAATVSELQHAQNIVITRDTWGIAHVHGNTDADAVFGMIYAQAEDDFPRIEHNYLISLGRRAEADGESAIWQDLRQRLFLDPVKLREQYWQSPVWLQRLMEAWADGLNYYLATHPAVHPLLLTHFEPWMALSFTEGSIGGDIESASLTQLQAFYEKRSIAMTAEEALIQPGEPQGSNGFAIAPSDSIDGHALLYINPHTSFFFRSELQMTSEQGLNVYGAVTWGQFFVYQGFNATAGWMHTSSGVDNIDEFSEEVSFQGKKPFYKYAARMLPVSLRSISLQYRAADGKMLTRTFTGYFTVHGPVVRKEGKRWISMSIMNRPILALEQSYLQTKSRSYAEFEKVANLRANSSNNTIFADNSGNIAYLHPEFIPIRNDTFDYTKLLDGTNPATSWKGLHSLTSEPKVLNPQVGWVMNTNDAPWTAAGRDSPKKSDFPRYMDQYGENPRGLNLERILSSHPKFDLPSLIATGFDSYLIGFKLLVPPLLDAYDRSPQPSLAAPIALLRGWDYRCGYNSEATSLAVFWGEEMLMLQARLAKRDGQRPFFYMVDHSTDAQRLDALHRAITHLQQSFGDWRIPWGSINRFQRLDDSITPHFDDKESSIAVPFTSARWGSLAAFEAQAYPNTNRYYGDDGNSFVAAVEFGPKVRALAIIIGGESGNPDSPHFNDESVRYANGNLREVYFYPEQLLGHTERVYRPGQ